MKANKAEQNALVTLLNRIYGEIRAIEEEWDIRADANDYRPRVEYFHDAIRALTSGNMAAFQKGGRLSVEFLAYDMEMLRHIQANPMKKPKGAKMTESVRTDVVVRSAPGSASIPDGSSVRIELSERYKTYSVLFAALLADTAERNYQSRINTSNTEVEEASPLDEALKQTAQKNDVVVNLEALIDQTVDDPMIAQKLLAAMGGKKTKDKASALYQKLKLVKQTIDKDIRDVEKAHFSFVTAQLAVYENAKDVVKKMAMGGMNIVGNFVQNAVAEATRGGGRRGM